MTARIDTHRIGIHAALTRAGEAPGNAVAEAGPYFVAWHVTGDLYAFVSDVAAFGPDLVGLPDDTTAAYVIDLMEVTGGSPFDLDAAWETERVASWSVHVDDGVTDAAAIASLVPRVRRRAWARRSVQEYRAAVAAAEAREAALDAEETR